MSVQKISKIENNVMKKPKGERKGNARIRAQLEMGFRWHPYKDLPKLPRKDTRLKALIRKAI